MLMEFIVFDLLETLCHPKHGQEKIQRVAGLLPCFAPFEKWQTKRVKTQTFWSTCFIRVRLSLAMFMLFFLGGLRLKRETHG